MRGNNSEKQKECRTCARYRDFSIKRKNKAGFGGGLCGECYKAVKSHDVCKLWVERGTSVGMSKSAEIRMVNDTNEAFSRLLRIFEDGEEKTV